MSMFDKGYNGIVDLKRPNTPINFTPEQIQEIINCKSDPLYFLRYVKIRNVDSGKLIEFKPYPYQVKVIKETHENRFIITKFPRQSGKALALDTPILTTTGMKTMGDINVGDIVYGKNGKPTSVLFTSDVMINRNCYRVTFDNGEEIVADAEHLWEISNSDWEHRKKVMTTSEVLNVLEKKLNNGSGVYVDVPEAVQYDSKELPINPYLLGLWLGDGTKASGAITAHVSDYEHYTTKIDDQYLVRQENNVVYFRIKGLTRKLRFVGVLNNKHIPNEYLTSSVDQRLELLRGLMDSDGNVCKKGACEFYQKEGKLISDVRYLLSSLGIKSRIRKKIIGDKNYYTLAFTTDKFEVFSLPRKKTNQKNCFGSNVNKRLYIKSIVEEKSVPVKCIGVDNEDKLFLCGNTLIPTHNSTCYVAYALWSILFNQNYIVAILAHMESQAKEILRRIKTAYMALPKWLQQGIRRWNEKDIELENGSIIYVAATSTNAIRGNSPNMLLLDEFAFVPSRIAADFMGSAYPTISSGQTTKIAIVSTPNGMNLFYKMWMDAVEKRSSYKPLEIFWNDVPGRDESFKKETIANLPGGESQWEQEFECVFLGSTNTLISSVKLQTLAIKNPLLYKDRLKIYEFPREGRRYILTADVAEGVGKDYSTFSVFDVTEFPYKQIAVFKNNEISTLDFPGVIHDVANLYNQAHVLIELNSLGTEVSNILWNDYSYENMIATESKTFKGTTLDLTGKAKGIKTTKSTKRLGCQTLKHLIENDKLLVNDDDTIFELSNFVKKNNSYMAEEGFHDDIVMTLVTFAWLTAQKDFGLFSEYSLRREIHQEDSTPPSMYFFDDFEEESKVVDFDRSAVWTQVDMRRRF